MPLNVRRFLAFIFLVLVSIFTVNAQTSVDVMRGRVAKAKAFIAVKNYNAAIYELENIRRETGDPTVHSVINVLLINSYLEQGDYKRAQEFLAELAKKPNAAANYLAAAGQVVRGARTQLERYKSLGLSVSDRNLPQDAAADIEKMRQTLETVVEQSKVLGKDKAQTANAMALLEEATVARSSLAKDDYDASRWKNEAADAREILANSRSVVVNAVTSLEVPNPNNVASNTPTPVNPNTTTTTTTTNPVLLPVAQNTQPQTTTNNSTPANNTTAKIEKPIVTETPKEEAKKTEDAPKTATEKTETTSTRTRLVPNVNTENVSNAAAQTKTENVNPLEVGSLIEFATQRVNPVYPAAAKSIRQTGVVKVELTIDEQGQVSTVGKSSGPALLQSAAKDAIKKWKFKPFVRDGQPVKATGFVSFNFNL